MIPKLTLKQRCNEYIMNKKDGDGVTRVFKYGLILETYRDVLNIKSVKLQHNLLL